MSAPTYTLIAYKPEGSSPNCGCGCSGYTSSSADFEMKRGLPLEQLAVEIARLRLVPSGGHREDYLGEPYDIQYFDDLGGPDWRDGDSFDAIDNQLEALIAQQQPIIKAKQEKEAKEKEERERKAEQARREKYEAEQREKRDQEEYARLKSKFESRSGGKL